MYNILQQRVNIPDEILTQINETRTNVGSLLKQLNLIPLSNNSVAIQNSKIEVLLNYFYDKTSTWNILNIFIQDIQNKTKLLKESIEKLYSKKNSNEIYVQRNIEKIKENWEMLNKCVIERTGLDSLLI